MFSNNFTPIKPHKFDCEKCDFHTCNKKDFTRHTKSIKHIRNENSNLSMNFTQNYPNYPNHTCLNCGKEYKDNSGLWRHKKKCNTNEPTVENNNQTSEIQELKEFWYCDIVLKQKTSNNEVLMFLREIPEAEIITS